MIAKKRYAKGFLCCIFVFSCMCCLTAAASSTVNVINETELKEQTYKGKFYEYALQKQYETDNKDVEMSFNDKIGRYVLSDIGYEIVETVQPDTEQKEITENKIYKDLLERDEGKIPQTISKDGVEYRLKNVEWSEEDNIEKVDYMQDCGYCTSEPDVPKTYEYTYESPVTGKENTVTLPFVRLDKDTATWVKGFSATVTFHNIEERIFTLGKHEIEYDKDTLSLNEDDYKELVKMLGYDTSLYRLTDIAWSSKPYQKDGETCRDATATGEQYATSYKALYADEVANGKIYTANATYAAKTELSAGNETPVYIMQATAYYKEKNTLPIIMSIGIVIFLIWFTVVLFALSRKEKKYLMATSQSDK